MSRRLTRIHQKVADILDMDVNEAEAEEDFDDSLVPVPESHEITLVDNPELPALHEEMLRLEHGERQTEFLLEHGLAAVQQSLTELNLMPPMYKPKAVMAAAELFSAVANLSQHKTDVQLKRIELKLKLAAFSRNKAASNNITGNTFIINREELIKAYSETEEGDD
jgi:hypothetical protein